jgi:hypothetical protein
MTATAYRTADATVAAHRAVAVTPSDATVIEVTRALYIGTGGTLVVHMAGETSATTVTYTNVAAGIFPIQVDMVYSTSTTASNIVALY